MILTGDGIIQKIKKGQIVLRPFNKANIGPATYHFSLDKDLLIPNKSGFPIDLSKPKMPPLIKKSIDQPGGFTLRPNQYILGKTKEKVSLSNSIAMFLDGRSTLARLGLTVHQTATFCQPGHRNFHIILEILNVSPNILILRKDMLIAKGIFFCLSKGTEIHYQNFSKKFKQRDLLLKR